MKVPKFSNANLQEFLHSTVPQTCSVPAYIKRLDLHQQHMEY